MDNAPAPIFDDEALPDALIAGSPAFLVACLSLFRASELWGARMGTFLAEALPTAEMRSRALIHTAEEVSHTRLFDRRICELGGSTTEVPKESSYLVCCARAGVIPPVERLEGSPTPLLSTTECVQLFAGLHVIERRGVYALSRFAAALPSGDRSRAVFETIVSDEATHADTNLAALTRILPVDGAEARAVEAVQLAIQAEKVAWAAFLAAARTYAMAMFQARGSADEEVERTSANL